jgi:hypothetical protein
MKLLNNQKGIAPVIVLVLLLAGLGVGTFLVQNRTNLFPKAQKAQSPRIAETSFSLSAYTDSIYKETSSGSNTSSDTQNITLTLNAQVSVSLQQNIQAGI